MHGVGRLVAHGPEVVPLQDVQGDECRDPLSVGRALVDAVTAIVRVDRLDPRGGVVRQVLQGEQPVVALGGGHDGASDRPVVKGIGAALGQEAQAARQVRRAMALSGAGRATVGQVGGRRRGILSQERLTRLPGARDPRAHREAALGIVDGWLEDAVEAQPAKTRHGIGPAGGRARHGDGKDTAEGHLAEAPALHLLQGGGVGGAPARVQGVHAAILGPVDEGKGVAAHAGAHRLDDIEHGGRGHGGVGGVAALHEDAQPRLRGEGLAGGYGTSKSHDHGAARGELVRHDGIGLLCGDGWNAARC